MTDYFTARASDKYLVGMTDLGGAFDIAASLRGHQELVFDMIERPEETRDMISAIDDIWFEAYDILHKKIAEKCEGMTCWMPVWSRDRWYPLQCDFGAILSPRLFEEFVKPSLENEARFLDRALFHLDGPDMVKHADSILDIEGINAIQWRPTEYDGPDASYVYEKWIPLYKKIQAKKRSIVMLGVNPKEIEEILKYVSPRGLYMQTSCSSEEEASDLLRQVERWGRVREMF
jgi:5-methyltetrahydrofolate--homocysteine methyltransferase